MDANPAFTARPSGTIGWEIIGPRGVVAWATDAYWAMLIAAVLNKTERDGLDWHDGGNWSRAEDVSAERRA
jgi:hypothetical protein